VRQAGGHETINGFSVKSSLVNGIFRAVMEAVYPPRCYVCDDHFDASPTPAEHGSRLFAGLMAEHLCPTCAADFLPIGSPLCPTCGIMFKSSHGPDHVCGECRRLPRRYRSARAAGIYEKSLMTVLQQLKYRGRVELAAPLGRLLLAAFFRWYPGEFPDLITPVPLHARKQRQRGFNQAWLLLREWQRTTTEGRPVLPVDKFRKDLLVRTRMTRSQTTLSRRERLANVRGAFALKDKNEVKGKSVLLVDDVYTTGATVDECARVLMAAGAAGVDVLTVARVK
jgi:ComF family protein